MRSSVCSCRMHHIRSPPACSVGFVRSQPLPIHARGTRHDVLRVYRAPDNLAVRFGAAYPDRASSRCVDRLSPAWRAAIWASDRCRRGAYWLATDCRVAGDILQAHGWVFGSDGMRRLDQLQIGSAHTQDAFNQAIIVRSAVVAGRPEPPGCGRSRRAAGRGFRCHAPDTGPTDSTAPGCGHSSCH